MSRQQRIEKVLHENFKCEYLELENESHHHSGHYEGSGDTHWRAIIVAPEFQGLSRIQRHQAVNQLIRSEWESGLHALSLQVYTPEEWQQRQE